MIRIAIPKGKTIRDIRVELNRVSVSSGYAEPRITEDKYSEGHICVHPANKSDISDAHKRILGMKH